MAQAGAKFGSRATALSRVAIASSTIAAAHEGSTAQVVLIGIHVGRAIRDEPLALCQTERRAQCARNGLRDVLFDREHVGELAVVTVRPEVDPVVGLDQLRRYAHTVARAAHGAVDEIGRAERLADRAEVLALVFELKSRRAPDDTQVRHFRKRRRDLVGHAVGEELLLPRRRIDWRAARRRLRFRSRRRQRSEPAMAQHLRRPVTRPRAARRDPRPRARVRPRAPNRACSWRAAWRRLRPTAGRGSTRRSARSGKRRAAAPGRTTPPTPAAAASGSDCR